MGKIVWLEAYRVRRLEKMRHEALLGFPWGKLSKMINEVLEPSTRTLAFPKRYAVDEAIYRLAFEAYVSGIDYSRRGEMECPPSRPEGERRRWCDRVYRESGDDLINRVIQDLDLFRHLDEWTIQSVFYFMEEVASRWFIQGVDYGIRLRQQGSL
ncbi:hypothetical protein [Paludifilum halophilum]|uniref:DUF2521 domain-containing protein n=1 Tax=Paludifilum halophilum TaxID=1642702 RepID=A0A235B2J5_9BACL|nr:hypothetical protein [Paludifilum halophilum]OYD06503.1 hypothetical protein CHM34_15480 [Paludifilum halophilum]